jgi:hypothetical protein
MTTTTSTIPSSLVPGVGVGPTGATNPAISVEDLAGLLGELSGVQDELFRILEEKRKRMVARDAAGMDAAQTREIDLCSKLESIQQRRTTMLHAAEQRGLPHANLQELARALPRGGKVAKDATIAANRMRLLQRETLTNWVLAQRSLLHLSQMMEFLATGGRLMPTYGEGTSANDRGNLVDDAG